MINLNNLTEREYNILKLSEYTAQDISDMLLISKRTVEFHRKNLIVKLGITIKSMRMLVKEGKI